MFARSVSIRVKPNSIAEFNKTLENKILPLPQKQKGFKLLSKVIDGAPQVRTYEVSASTIHKVGAYSGAS